MHADWSPPPQMETNNAIVPGWGAKKNNLKVFEIFDKQARIVNIRSLVAVLAALLSRTRFMPVAMKYLYFS